MRRMRTDTINKEIYFLAIPKGVFYMPYRYVKNTFSSRYKKNKHTTFTHTLWVIKNETYSKHKTD